MKFAYAFAAMIVAPFMAVAETTPEGCEAVLTVQKHGCEVTHIYQCEQGIVKHINIDQDEFDWVSLFGPDYIELESKEEITGIGLVGMNAISDPRSLHTLLTTGRDTVAYRGEFDMPGLLIGAADVSSQSRLMDEVLEIGGVTWQKALEEIVFQVRPHLAMTGTQDIWIDAESGILFHGSSSHELAGKAEETDNTPVEVIYPGQPGFLSMSPIYDCGEMMSALPFSENHAG